MSSVPQSIPLKEAAVNTETENDTGLDSTLPQGQSVTEETTPTRSGQQQEQAFHHKVMLVYEAVLGPDFAQDKSWSENGLTSLKRAELLKHLQENCQVQIPVNFEQLYQTPQDLQCFLVASAGTSFPVQGACAHPDFQGVTKAGPSMTVLQLGTLQALGILLVIALFTLSLLPSYYAGKEAARWNENLEVGNAFVTWRWLPIVVPLFMLSFTLELIIVKWLLIGKYEHAEIHSLSWAYLRYWFVDSLVALWEFLVGSFIVDTKFLWLAYRLLGTNISLSVSTEAFMREFDLIHVGEFSSVSREIKCRKFLPWHDNDSSGGPSLVMRPIHIGNACQINGSVGPGASIGDGSKVDSLSAVAEGAQVPEKVIATGNPAYNGGQHMTEGSSDWYEECTFDVIKVSWLLVESYLFFGLFFVSEMIVQHLLHGCIGFRYTPVLFWFIALPVTSILGIAVSIGLKWLLVGKRDLTKPYGNSMYRRSTNWICDYHFRLSVFSLAPYFGVSRVWNAILFLHGLDIDCASALNAGFDLWGPSQVDYFKVCRSFVAGISFDMDAVDHDGTKTEIVNSSIGKDSSVGRGLKVFRSALPPCSKVDEDMIDLSPDLASNEAKTSQRSVLDFLVPELAQLALVPLIFVSFLPAYELFMATVYDTTTVVALLGVCGSILTQISVLAVLRNLVEVVTHQSPPKIRSWFYGAYMNHTYVNSLWGFSRLLQGTPLFAFYLRFLGAHVEGELWCFDATIYDPSQIRLGPRTILDGCSVNGHFVDARGLTVERVYVAGLVHPGCLILAGAVVSGEEHGPNKLFFRSTKEVDLDQPPCSELSQTKEFQRGSKSSSFEIEV